MDWKSIHYDAIVVGSGAAGGMAAKCLSDGGATVLLLEAGARLPPEAYAEQDRSPQQFNNMRARQPVQSRGLHYSKRNCHLFIDDLDNPYTTAANTTFNWIRSRQAGGRTAVWSRFAPRMSDREFGSAERDGIGTPWPLGYQELASYYDKVEALTGVRCTVEGRSSSYLVALGEQLARRYPERHLFPSKEVAAPPAHTSVASTLLRCSADRLTLRANCVVARVELERPNHAKGVVFVDRETKRWYEVRARVVVLCASTIESARILLASASPDYPTGLANSSGLLGHHLMDHFGGCRAVAMGRIEGVEPPHQERACIPRFDDLHRQTQDFVRGYGMQLDFRAEEKDNVILTLGVFGEVLPYFENAVELDDSTHDSCGLAVARIRYSYRDNEHHMALHAQAAAREIIDALGFRLIIAHDETLPGGTRAHELGTVRMGTTPVNSVLNAFNQSWDIDNLFVTDGACFPSAGCLGPTLTIMALTARACDFILSRFRTGAL